MSVSVHSKCCYRWTTRVPTCSQSCPFFTLLPYQAHLSSNSVLFLLQPYQIISIMTWICYFCHLKQIPSFDLISLSSYHGSSIFPHATKLFKSIILTPNLLLLIFFKLPWIRTWNCFAKTVLVNISNHLHIATCNWISIFLENGLIYLVFKCIDI